MHFLYKLDHLGRSMRGFDENSSTMKRLKLGMVSSFHPHSMCTKLRGLRQKLDALRVQTRPSPSKYNSFRRKLTCYKGISFLKTYLNSRLFVYSICTIHGHILKFTPFVTSFAIFQAFNDLFCA